MLTGIVGNVIDIVHNNPIISDKQLIINISYSKVRGKHSLITLEELYELDIKDIKKVLNNIITYTYNSTQLIWDYAEFLTHNKKNKFEILFFNLNTFNKNAILIRRSRTFGTDK